MSLATQRAVAAVNRKIEEIRAQLAVVKDEEQLNPRPAVSGQPKGKLT